MKLYLRARVPNEGAHRLAWWIEQQPDAAAAYEAVGASIGTVAHVDRLLDGDLTPGMAWGLAIANVTGGQVRPNDWYRETDLWWFTPPAERDHRWAARIAA